MQFPSHRLKIITVLNVVIKDVCANKINSLMYMSMAYCNDTEVDHDVLLVGVIFGGTIADALVLPCVPPPTTRASN